MFLGNEQTVLYPNQLLEPHWCTLEERNNRIFTRFIRAIARCLCTRKRSSPYKDCSISSIDARSALFGRPITSQTLRSVSSAIVKRNTVHSTALWTTTKPHIAKHILRTTKLLRSGQSRFNGSCVTSCKLERIFILMQAYIAIKSTIKLFLKG